MNNKLSIGAGTMCYPTPVYLVGTYDENEKANIMVAAWGGVACSTPPCFSVAIRTQRHTHSAIIRNNAFTLSIPHASILDKADYAGIASGRNTDKFADTGLTPIHSSLVNAPYVQECPLNIELSLINSMELGTHTLFIGKVEDIKVEKQFVGMNGEIDFRKMEALSYDPGLSTYRVTGQSAGKAFSAGKKFLQNK